MSLGGQFILSPDRASLGSPITTEILGLAGFDWLLLDGEHAPTT